MMKDELQRKRKCNNPIRSIHSDKDICTKYLLGEVCDSTILCNDVVFLLLLLSRTAIFIFSNYVLVCRESTNSQEGKGNKMIDLY